MKKISLETKEAIVEQALNRNGKSLAAIAAANHIGYSTLQRWLRKARAGTSLDAGKSTTLNRKQQLEHLLATSRLDETALGAYCRQHGIYSHQLTDWKEVFMSESKQDKRQQQREELRRLKAENKRLQRDLQRKDKALAEASALLILKKKPTRFGG